jgi:hypothetical protein
MISAYELRERAEYERMRFIAYNDHIHSMASKKSKSITAFLPFHWDKTQEGKPVRVVKTPKEIWDEYHRLKAEREKKNGGNP